MIKVLIGAVVGAAAGYGMSQLASSKHEACYLANHKVIPGTIITIPGTPLPEQVDAQCDKEGVPLSYLKDPYMTLVGFAALGALAGYALK